MGCRSVGHLPEMCIRDRLKALQSQINPHFLYNTLDMIKWFSYSGRNEDIDKVVTELARFYKLTLNRGKEIVTVEDELSLIHISCICLHYPM